MPFQVKDVCPAVHRPSLFVRLVGSRPLLAIADRLGRGEAQAASKTGKTRAATNLFIMTSPFYMLEKSWEAS